MKRFFVQLTWPKSAGYPVYCNELDAPDKAAAIQITENQARREGFTRTPRARTARQIGVPA